MAVKVTGKKESFVSPETIKMVSMIFLGISIFFGVLFFTSFNIVHSDDFLGQTSDDRKIFIYLVTLLALSVGLISMEFYHVKHRIVTTLKYCIIIATATIVGLAINELTKGYDTLFSDDQSEAEATMYTYAALTVGFAGVGTLLSLIHNFHAMMADL